MKTSNFANNKNQDFKGISISRFPPRWSVGVPEYPPLMPSAQLLKNYKEGMDWETYAFVYNNQLDCLNCEKVYAKLLEMADWLKVKEPILLCFESAKTLDTQPCHRRLAAKWFENELGIVVPEWTNVQ